MLLSSFGNNSFFHFRLLVDKFNFSQLLLGHGRNDEEKGNDKECRHKREMEYVRAACGLGQLNNKIGINPASFQGCMIISITHRISDIAEKETDKNPGNGTAHMRFQKYSQKHFVRLHVELLTELQKSV